MVEIYDCRQREKIVTKRVGGDFELAVYDDKGNLITKYWLEMKRPYKKTFEELEKLMEEFKWHLKKQGRRRASSRLG